ncbi:hypothetical protein Afil01_67180 [Actinorhabdospora filicis]|uniref:Pyrroline-5-carboxylate reductase catalytic N-terminal domain-containing protein n=1 Tax=Actinorhabdospora filicis TaxID=1785913 RepID=A0A9W6SWB0_9ACTN|nr:NAD(P)-binding domain-containing protein [Actinorhabdospora filicis]GLZ81911.1 hypothetical protein Afil01_67180 [Actinorhabdospora filicis]
MTLAIIGGGMIGSAVAWRAVAAGLDVVLSNSREPSTLAGLAASLGARAAFAAEAALAADVVVAAIPVSAFGKLPARALAGKIVVDTANYYPERDGHLAELDSGALTSSELLQRHLPSSTVVKGFNAITPHQIGTLARPAGAADRSALPIAGEAGAKAEVARLLDRLGFDAADAGVLAESWRAEPGTPAYILPYLGEGGGVPRLDGRDAGRARPGRAGGGAAGLGGPAAGGGGAAAPAVSRVRSPRAPAPRASAARRWPGPAGRARRPRPPRP